MLWGSMCGIAGGAGEARVTISAMTRAIALFFAALALVSCGRDEPATEPTSAAAVEAQEAADEALASIANLEEQTADLTDELAELKADRKKLAERMWDISGNLRAAIAELKGSLGDIEGDVDGAAARASEALDEVGAAARELAVLENRFDYHLRRGH